MQNLKPQQIAKLRSQLVSRQQQLETQLGQGNSAAKPVTLDQQSVGRISRIDAIQQQQMALASQQQTIRLKQQIESALTRLDAGDYGLCLQCFEPIAFKRLQAQPVAELCIDCQAAREIERG